MRYTLAIVKAPRGRVLGAFNWWGWWDLNPLPSLHWWTVKGKNLKNRADLLL